MGNGHGDQCAQTEVLAKQRQAVPALRNLWPPDKRQRQSHCHQKKSEFFHGPVPTSCLGHKRPSVRAAYMPQRQPWGEEGIPPEMAE
mmetsp:Transcript_10811/g.17624  ORF Transcript_10811/g.17624 Transcript_10811/m.17624 type:complete len:87 (+) Transcript_10811:330-590(+)